MLHNIHADAERNIIYPCRRLRAGSASTAGDGRVDAAVGVARTLLFTRLRHSPDCTTGTYGSIATLNCMCEPREQLGDCCKVLLSAGFYSAARTRAWQLARSCHGWVQRHRSRGCYYSLACAASFTERA